MTCIIVEYEYYTLCIIYVIQYVRLRMRVAYCAQSKLLYQNNFKVTQTKMK